MDKTARAPALRATELYFRKNLAENTAATKHFYQLARASAFFQGCAPGTIGKPHYGHATWWQLNVLLYMLAHPKPAYRTREFVRHLASQKVRVDAADLRRFCRKHRIARDTRAGRPVRTDFD